MGERGLCHIVSGNVVGAATMENSTEVLRKTKTELPYDPRILLLSTYSDKTRTKKDTFTPVFTAALFTTAKTRCRHRRQVASVVSDSVRPHRQQPTRLPRPWDSPGKNTGVGCHFLLQRMKVKSESKVAQSCPTLSDPMDCSLPGSSIHRIFQARGLE